MIASTKKAFLLPFVVKTAAAGTLLLAASLFYKHYTAYVWLAEFFFRDHASIFLYIFRRTTYVCPGVGCCAIQYLNKGERMR